MKNGSKEQKDKLSHILDLGCSYIETHMDVIDCFKIRTKPTLKHAKNINLSSPLILIFNGMNSNVQIAIDNYIASSEFSMIK